MRSPPRGLPRLRDGSSLPADTSARRWIAGASFDAFGLGIGVRTNRHELLSALLRILPPGARATARSEVDVLFSLYAGARPWRSRGARLVHVVYRGGTPIAECPDLDEALAHLDGALRLDVAAMAPRHVFVHAGVVGWRGAALVLPGRTYAGKSTLVEALVRAGARYYSDEYAVLDKEGRVHGYPRPLMRREPGLRLARPVPIEEIGGKVGRRPLPIRLVIATRYDAGASWQPRRMTSGQTILALLDNTVPARLAPGRVMPTLKKSVAAAIGFEGVRGEAAATAELMLSALEDLNAVAL